MSTHNQMPQPAIPVRGQVQKTFIPTKVLAGFTGQNHLMQIIGEYFNSASPTEQQQILQDAAAAQGYVQKLAPIAPVLTELRQINHSPVGPDLQSGSL